MNYSSQCGLQCSYSGVIHYELRNVNCKKINLSGDTILAIDHQETKSLIGRFQAVKTDVLLIFSFITGDKTEFLSPMMFSNEYITGI